jgi:hypothetical protein
MFNVFFLGVPLCKTRRLSAVKEFHLIRRPILARTADVRRFLLSGYTVKPLRRYAITPTL